MSVRATLRRTWPVLLSYGLFSAWGLGCFMVSVFVSSAGFSGASAETSLVLLGIVAACAVGHVLGNLLGLAGLRLAPVVVLFGLLFAGAALFGAVAGTFALFVFVGVLAAIGGYLGIASRLDVVASWYPLSFSVAAAMVWINTHEKVDNFFGGEKHAIWDAFTLLCLAGGVFFMLVFLATRQSLGLTVWQEVGRRRGANELGSIAVARPGRGSLVVLLVFTAVVLGATALISPYLFRSHEAEDGKGGRTTQQHDGETKPKDGEPKKKKPPGKKKVAKKKRQQGHGEKGYGQGQGEEQGQGDGQGQGGSGQGEDEDEDDDGSEPFSDPDTEGAKQAAAEAMAGAMQLLAWLLAMVVALLLLLLVLVPPLRRVFLLRHLERPLWPVPPTSRVMNLWRRALAALEVVDIVPTPGEAPRDFAARAEREAAEQLGADAGALKEAAAVVENIDYAGRGLGAEDERRMRDVVMRVVHAVEPRTTFKKKLAAAWGRAPEVE